MIAVYAVALADVQQQRDPRIHVVVRVAEPFDGFARSAFVRDELPRPFADCVRPVLTCRLDVGYAVAKPSSDLFAGPAVVIADGEQSSSDAYLDGIPIGSHHSGDGGGRRDAVLHDGDHDGFQHMGLALGWPAAADDEEGNLTETTFADDRCQRIPANEDIVVSYFGDGCRP